MIQHKNLMPLFNWGSSSLKLKKDANAKRQNVKKNTANATIQDKYAASSANARAAKIADASQNLF